MSVAVAALAFSGSLASTASADQATDDLVAKVLESARQSLVAGDRARAAALAHRAFELLVTADRTVHKKLVTTDERDLSTRR